MEIVASVVFVILVLTLYTLFNMYLNERFKRKLAEHDRDFWMKLYCTESKQTDNSSMTQIEPKRSNKLLN